MTVPNRIVLISRGRHDEAVSTADCYPGMVLAANSSAPQGVAPHAVVGGSPVGGLMVVEEDALQGLDITQKIPSGQVTPFRRAAKGDSLLMLLQNGQNVGAGVGLVSAGDGTLIASTGADLYDIVAPSSVITNTATETAFSNGTYTFPANFFQVGDVIHIRVKVFCIAENSTNTHRFRVYFDVTPTTLSDSAAQQFTANDVSIMDITLTVRTVGAGTAGTFVADGTLATSVGGTFTTTSFTVASTTFDTTLATALVVKSLASAANVGNQVRLDEFTVKIDRGSQVLVYSQEAINNSGGTGTSNFNTAAFVRCQVP